LQTGVVAPALFVVSFLVQGAVRPGYDPLRHPVSSLVLGSSSGLVQAVTVVLTGLLVAAYAIAIWQRLRLVIGLAWVAGTALRWGRRGPLGPSSG
jgi:hypothetical protein